MPARLVPLSGPSVGGPVVLQRPVLLFGRHPECDIRLELPEISRRHCCVAQAYERLLIRDLGSRNGVRVNGRLVSEAPLHPGDEVAIAHLIYRFEADPAPAVAPRPEPAAPRPAPPTSTPAARPDLPGEDDDILPDFGLISLDDD